MRVLPFALFLFRYRHGRRSAPGCTISTKYIQQLSKLVFPDTSSLPWPWKNREKVKLAYFDCQLSSGTVGICIPYNGWRWGPRTGDFCAILSPSKSLISISRENETLMGSGSGRVGYKLINKNIPGTEFNSRGHNTHCPLPGSGCKEGHNVRISGACSSPCFPWAWPSPH